MNLAGVLQRHKDIMYSSRSRFTTEKIAETQQLRGAMRRLIERLPEQWRDDPDLRALDASLRSPHVDIVHLIYRQSAFESDSKDYEFSRPSMLEHWSTGVADMRCTHQHLDLLQASSLDSNVTVYDLAQGFEAAHGPAGKRDREEKVALAKASKTLAARPSAPNVQPSRASETAAPKPKSRARR